jgi:hypothetical protein
MNSAIPMKVQYRITEDDYANALRFHAWRHFIARPSSMQLVAGGVIVILLGVGVWTRPAIAAIFAAVLAVFAILLAIGWLVGTPSRARRHYRQYRGIQEPITIELTEAGIKFSNADGEGILPWSKALQWRQNDRFILIYTMPIIFHIIPKSIEHEGFDVALLVQRLVEHVGPER